MIFGSPPRVDNFRRLAGGTSFLLGLIRGGGGTVHVPRSAEVPHFSLVYISYSRIVYIYFDFYWEHISL